MEKDELGTAHNLNISILPCKPDTEAAIHTSRDPTSCNSTSFVPPTPPPLPRHIPKRNPAYSPRVPALPQTPPLKIKTKNAFEPKELLDNRLNEYEEAHMLPFLKKSKSLAVNACNEYMEAPLVVEATGEVVCEYIDTSRVLIVHSNESAVETTSLSIKNGVLCPTCEKCPCDSCKHRAREAISSECISCITCMTCADALVSTFHIPRLSCSFVLCLGLLSFCLPCICCYWPLSTVSKAIAPHLQCVHRRGCTCPPNIGMLNN